MKKKLRVKQFLSGMMAVVTLLSTAISPITAYAAKPEKTKAEYPAYEEVKEQLSAEEVVTAKDYEVSLGTKFDAEIDFTGIEIVDDEKVKVTFHEAKNEAGESFSTEKEDTYKATYYVEPASGHPVYQIHRNLVVKESKQVGSEETTLSSEETGTGGTEETEEDAEESERQPETEITGDIPISEVEETEMDSVIDDEENSEEMPEGEVSQETEQIQAVTIDVAENDLESITSSDAEELIVLSAVSTQSSRSSNVSLEVGKTVRYPSNLGNYVTSYFYVNGHLAYCLESAKATPGEGGYVANVISSNQSLQKALYYGYGGAGDVTGSYMSGFDADLKYVFTHIAASYFYCGMAGFTGCTMDDLQECGVLDWIHYLEAQPMPPEPDIQFSSTREEAVASGNEQKTGTIKLQGDSRNHISFSLPSGVTIHNTSTGAVQTEGTVTVNGGESFFFTAPFAVTGTWNSGNLSGSIKKVWQALVVSTGDYSQDIGSGYYSEETAAPISFQIKWLDYAEVKVSKKDADTGNGLQGAVFGIYQDAKCTQLITTMAATNFSGTASVKIPKTQDTVYVKEITPPTGYQYNTDSFNVKIDFGKTSSISVPDKRVEAEIQLIKQDSETGESVPQGDASLKGAVYGLYARESIVHPDGHTGTLYPKDSLVGTFTTDEKSTAKLSGLYLGNYYAKEITAPEGYLTDGQEHEISCTYEGGNVAVVKRSCIVPETVKKQAFEMIKISTDGSSTETALVEGAEFTIKLESDIKANGWEKAKVYDTLLTDAKGYARSIELPYGTYHVKETKTPDNVNTTKDFYVTVSEDSRTPQVWRVFNDAPFKAYIRLIKKDVDTGNVVQVGGTTFKIRDLKTGEDVSMKVGSDHVTTFTTDETGMVTTPLMLQAGKYEVYEITAPEGYVVKTESIPFTVTSKGEYHTDEDGDFVVDVEIHNTQQYGNVNLYKHGEALTKVEKEGGLVEMVKSLITGENRNLSFVYEDKPIEGSVFHIVCDEDIYTADQQTDEAGNRILATYQGVELKKGAVAAILTTDQEGKAVAEKFPLGKYHIEETQASHGYVLNETQDAFALEYAEQDVELVYHDSDFANERQKTALSLIKKSTKEEKTVEGAVYGLYAKEDIASAEGQILAEADTLIETQTTDAEGKISFGSDLPLDTYYVKETKAAPGYLLDEESYDVDFTYQGQNVKVITNTLEVKDEPTITEISKTDIATGEEVVGAKLEILDESGEVVASWTSTEEKHIVYGIPAGDYVLRETSAPTEQGYVKAEDVTFTIEETGEVQKVEMKDDFTKVEISKVDITDGSTEVEGAKLYILDQDNKVLDSWVSAKEPHLIERLPVGKYTLLEKIAPKGYIISNKVTFEVKETGEVQKVTMEDAHAMGKIILNKTDKDTKKPLKGVEFTIYDSEGKELEILVTDSTGHAESKEYPIATFKDSKYDKQLTYTVCETKTLDGYKLDNTKHEVKFEYVDDKTPIIAYTLDVTNEKVPEEEIPSTQDTPSTTTTSAPKTGDESNIAVLLLLMGISAGGAGLLFWFKKRKK
ncbi:MAG: SpaA isopeptide-forming pilin-related protein [Hespellia sp.]|nr:SpaA isopeptide-forming pilin-related protein [Hespellia sp.]